MKIGQQPQIVPFTQNLLYGVLIQKDLSKFKAKTKSHDEINIVYFGTPEFSAYILEKLIEFCQNPPQDLNLHNQGEMVNLPKQFIVQTVVTGQDQKVGRKQLINQSLVASVADKYHIPVLKPEKLDEDFLTSHLSLLTSDLFIVASYGKIIPKNLLEIPKYGSINVHGSILPKYRGASPIQQVLLNGDKKSGITITLMDKEMDHGPILSTKEIKISDQDNFQILSNKIMAVGAELLLETFPKFIEGRIKPKPQNHKQATYCSRLTKESGYFDILDPPSPQKLDRMIRAYYPWPGVWTYWEVKSAKGKVKRVVKFLPGRLIQMEGKKPISLKDFQNGYPDFPLKILDFDLL